MPLANNALVLVTDGRKTLYFRNEGDINQIDLRTEAHDEREGLENKDLRSDAPGTVQQSAGYGHSTYEETDFKQLEEDRWAHSAAEEVNRRALANDFDALAIIAPPKTLGELRKHYHKEVENRLAGEIAKDLTGHAIPEIEQALIAAD